MKIAHLISNYPFPLTGGAECCLHNLAAAQARKSHIVKVIAPKNGPMPHLGYEVLPLHSKTVHILKFPFLNKPFFLDRLRLYQNTYRFDLWQVTMGYPFGIYAVRFFKKKKIPCVLRCAGEDIQIEPGINYGVRLRRGADLSIRKGYPQFDALIAIAESIAQDYLKIGVPEDKIYRISNGINKSSFDIETDRSTVLKRIGAGAEKRVVLTIGRNHPKKGLWAIPQIIASLSKRRDDFIWVLLGPGNGSIKKAAERLGVGDMLIVKDMLAAAGGRKEFILPARELVELYKSADIFVLPTLIEGCSNVILEAMASGLPAVSTDVPGVRDMIAHEDTGLLCDAHDRETMARNIERLLEDSRLYEKIRNNILKKTGALDWSVVAERYIGVYEDVIRKA